MKLSYRRHLVCLVLLGVCGCRTYENSNVLCALRYEAQVTYAALLGNKDTNDPMMIFQLDDFVNSGFNHCESSHQVFARIEDMEGVRRNWWREREMGSPPYPDPSEWWCFAGRESHNPADIDEASVLMFTANIPCDSLPCHIERFSPSPLGENAIIVLRSGRTLVVTVDEANRRLGADRFRCRVIRPGQKPEPRGQTRQN